ncbi:MAG: DUF2950 domain-containing protein [Phycisphaerales bacterium]
MTASLNSLHCSWRAIAAARRLAGLLSALFVAVLLVGCATPPQQFNSPEAAVDSLIAAARADNHKELDRILGSDAKEVLSSGDKVADANARAEFVRKFDEQHALVADGDGAMILEVGNNGWPLPIPVVKGTDGWYFDTAAGADELLSRRIGRNELDAIQVCLAICDAQREYAASDFTGDGWREYAQKFRSDAGKKNGLYWPSAPGEPDSPLGELVAGATAEGYFSGGSNRPQPFHGYYYRILSAQGPAAPGGAMNYVASGHMIGGFAVVAWPAEYANSGLKTFIVNHQGVVYQRDLGDDTEAIAKGMKEFNPDAGWEPCGALIQ